MLELPKKKKKISITVIEMNFLEHQVISEMTFISYVWIWLRKHLDIQLYSQCDFNSVSLQKKIFYGAMLTLYDLLISKKQAL